MSQTAWMVYGLQGTWSEHLDDGPWTVEEILEPFAGWQRTYLNWREDCWPSNAEHHLLEVSRSERVSLQALARELDKTHPGAASLREGLPETLTVLRLGVPPTLARTLRSTNTIESMISICREHAGNVKRWQDGQMALRWCAAGMVEAGKQFRRVNGYLHLPALRAALEAETARTVTGSCALNRWLTVAGA